MKPFCRVLNSRLEDLVDDLLDNEGRDITSSVAIIMMDPP